jgi:flagellar FliL protein
MLVVAGVGVMLYLDKKAKDAKPTIDKVIEGEHQAQQEEEKKEDQFIGSVIPMETFLVNLAGSRGGKLAKVNMELEVDGEKVQQEIEKRKPQIRDIIIIILSSKNYDQIVTKESKDTLRDEVRDTVNSFLTKGHIKRVYFTEFIVN